MASSSLKITRVNLAHSSLSNNALLYFPDTIKRYKLVELWSTSLWRHTPSGTVVEVQTRALASAILVKTRAVLICTIISLLRVIMGPKDEWKAAEMKEIRMRASSHLLQLLTKCRIVLPIWPKRGKRSTRTWQATQIQTLFRQPRTTRYPTRFKPSNICAVSICCQELTTVKEMRATILTAIISRHLKLAPLNTLLSKEEIPKFPQIKGNLRVMQKFRRQFRRLFNRVSPSMRLCNSR